MMPNLKDLKAQVENANAKGVENLSKKGVVVSENATTYDIMDAISEINIGAGLGYKSIVYNKEDDTITLIDKYDGEHTMTCNYHGGRLISIAYDGKEVDLTYLDNKLDYVGETNVDFTDAPIYGIEPLDYTVEFLLNNSAYETISVKSGFSVYKPSIDPPNQGEYRFNGWKIDDEYMEFPYMPHRDVVANAYFQKVREEMEMDGELIFIMSDKSGNARYKTNTGWCIGGCSNLQGTHGFVMLVAETENNCQITPDENYIYKGNLIYNGVTYYYCGATAVNGIQKVGDGILDTGYNPSYISNSNASEMAKSVLDKYFYVT